MYYRGAQAAVVVYDVSSPESFARAQAWVRELQVRCLVGCVFEWAVGVGDCCAVWGVLLKL